MWRTKHPNMQWAEANRQHAIVKQQDATRSAMQAKNMEIGKANIDMESNGQNHQQCKSTRGHWYHLGSIPPRIFISNLKVIALYVEYAILM